MSVRARGLVFLGPSVLVAMLSLSQARAQALGEANLAHGEGARIDAAHGLDPRPKAAVGDRQMGWTALDSTYRLSHGVPVDSGHAANWFALAVASGDPVGMYFLGVTAANAQSGSVNYVEAYKWLGLALASDGLPPTSPFREPALQLQATVVGKMTIDEISEGDRLVQQWRMMHSW